jgi:hypothetical protein
MSSFVIICQQPEDFAMFQNLPWDSMRFHGILWSSMRFYDVPVNRSVPTDANRGLTFYNEAEQKRLAHKDDQIARQLKKQLQNNLKLSQKSKRRNLKLQVAVQSVEVDGEPAAGSVKEPVVIATSRSGRRIKPTHKVIT